MGITFSTDLPEPQGTQDTPCLCAQMVEAFGLMMDGQDTPEIRAELAREADKGCPRCEGTGIEPMPADNPYVFDVNVGNGAALLSALALPRAVGERPIAEVRRALLLARNRDLSHLARETEITFGAPRAEADGTVEMRPLRTHMKGLTSERLTTRLGDFAAFVLRAHEAGATKINWW